IDVGVEGGTAVADSSSFEWNVSNLVLKNNSRYLASLALPGGTGSFTATVDCETYIESGSAAYLVARSGPGKDSFAVQSRGIPSTRNDGVLDMALATGPGDDVITADWS